MKRANSPETSPNRNVKRTKFTDRRPDNDEGNFDNEFEAPSARLSIKSESCVPEEISTSHQMACLTDHHVLDEAEKVVNPAVWPPAVMMKKSTNFEDDLKLIDEKFGKLRRQNVGIFIQLLPDTNDMRRKLISFLEANNLSYLTPKMIRVVIVGLPCDTSTQEVKEALIEKDLEVEEVFQRSDRRTKKPLPLFYAVLPNSDRNESIFSLTNLLNFNISVGAFGRSRIGRSTRNIPKEMKAKPKADAPKYDKTGQDGTSNAKMVEVTAFHNQKNNQELGLHMNNNIAESGPTTDLEDIMYIVQEFRKLFRKIDDAQHFAQQLRNATNSIEKFHLFSAVFLD